MSFLTSSPLRVTIALLLAACSTNTDRRAEGAAAGAVQGAATMLGALKDFQCDPSGAMLCMALLGAYILIVVPAGAVAGAVIGAASVDTDEPSARVGQAPAGVADGNYEVSNDEYSLRLAVSDSHFQGDAFCKSTGTPINFSGSIASDGTIKGIGKARAFRTYGGMTALAPFTVGGHWPVIELNTSACKLKK